MRAPGCPGNERDTPRRRAPRLTVAHAHPAPRTFRAGLIALGAALALAAPGTAAAADTLGSCGPGADLVAFSDALDKTTFGGFDVGGLSSLALTGGDRARALVDNQAATPARFYDLDLEAHGDLAPTVRAVTTLERPDGTPYTGQDFDGEGLVSLPDGSVLASSETEPTIRRFSRDGVELGRAAGARPLPRRARGRGDDEPDARGARHQP